MIDETSDVAELRRIDFAGALWFGLTLNAAVIGLAGLLAAGWRPADLPTGLAALWWAGAVLLLGSVACLGWAGCPVVAPDVHRSVRGKSLTVRVGLVGYLVAFAACGLAVLLA